MSDGIRRLLQPVCHPYLSLRFPCVEYISVICRFWTRAMKVATPQSAKQLARAFTDYLNGTHQEAESTASEASLSFESYLQVRLESIGIRVFYAVCGLPLSIPDVVFEDPLFVELQYLGSELLLLDNVCLCYPVLLPAF